MKTLLRPGALVISLLSALAAAQEPASAPLDGGSVPPNAAAVPPPAAPQAAPQPPPPPVNLSPSAREAAQNASEGPATEPIPPSPQANPEEGATSPLYRTNVIGDRPDPNLFGSSAETMPRDQIEALPGGDTQPVTNLVAMEPGVHMDSFGSNLHVRGNDGALLYVLDGIPMVSPSVGTVGQLLNTVPTRLIQNLEIYTGGFPVEYSYSLAGVADIRTRRATETPTGELQLTYGTYNEVDLAANYSQQMGKFSLIASGDYVSTTRGLDTPDAIDVLHDYRQLATASSRRDYEFDSQNRLRGLGDLPAGSFPDPDRPDHAASLRLAAWRYPRQRCLRQPSAAVCSLRCQPDRQREHLLRLGSLHLAHRRGGEQPALAFVWPARSTKTSTAIPLAALGADRRPRFGLQQLHPERVPHRWPARQDHGLAMAAREQLEGGVPGRPVAQHAWPPGLHA